MEDDIENISTLHNRFAKCNNSKCGSVFLFDPSEYMGEAGFLCPPCRDMIDISHPVQCKNCQSIINFLPAEPSEEPAIFYVERCSHCNGTKQDEKQITPFYFPEAFI